MVSWVNSVAFSSMGFRGMGLKAYVVVPSSLVKSHELLLVVTDVCLLVNGRILVNGHLDENGRKKTL